jgi:bacterioferritin-associated ferredoxin
MDGTFNKKARAEIPEREWLELHVQLDSDHVVKKCHFLAWGCHNLLAAAEKACMQMEKNKLSEIHWEGTAHWDLLIKEALLRLRDEFKLPLDEDELCHCRKIPGLKVDNAIVLGAHTPERVRAWTTASSGCGTCRPNVEKIISYRLK